MQTERPQTGTWTLIAPNGSTWRADCPLRCVAAEQRERVPDGCEVERAALEHLYNFIEETDDDEA